MAVPLIGDFTMAANDPDANLITYVGRDKASVRNKNRQESGCQVANPRPAAGSSMCRNFPFSQKFSDPKAITTYQCDEWPPALAQQDDFNQKQFKNSLRCMPNSENESLGGKLSGIVRNMNEDDFFRVDFTSLINNGADQTKLKYCLNQLGGTQPDCTQDGWQIEMREKQVQTGKIEAPYFRARDNNKYGWQGTPYAELYQCSVELERDGDSNFNNIKLFDFKNRQAGNTQSTTLDAQGTYGILGLPLVLQLKRTDAFNSRLEFQYDPSEEDSVLGFAWHSEQEGAGRGPWTDPESDPNRKPARYCKITDTGNNKQKVECWFPCFEHTDGR
ncbi:hypothetical protein SLS60_008931 [Paraconiothyrium brasiliense]|uniref:Deoxyribonuclease NucA/NucB domain-containing protein n=1 Tax=Paraconiothyrium brasiliense TaxID=300254 RepID=A0ABR3QYW8_9PLEO